MSKAEKYSKFVNNLKPWPKVLVEVVVDAVQHGIDLVNVVSEDSLKVATVRKCGNSFEGVVNATLTTVGPFQRKQSMSQKESLKGTGLTRISDALDRELRDKAAELGVSVSKLVRNALLSTVDLVENIVVDSARVENATNLGNNLVATTRIPRRLNPSILLLKITVAPAQVIGWQELVLNLNARQCRLCLKGPRRLWD